MQDKRGLRYFYFSILVPICLFLVSELSTDFVCADSVASGSANLLPKKEVPAFSLEKDSYWDSFLTGLQRVRSGAENQAVGLANWSSDVWDHFDQKIGFIEIRIEGVSRLRRQEVEAIMPARSSLVHWSFKREELRSKFLLNPLVKSVEFETCKSKTSIDCVLIRIEEQKPRLWVKTQFMNQEEAKYLVADDGRIIASIKQVDAESSISPYDRELLGRFELEELSNLSILDARNLSSVSNASQNLFPKALRALELVEEMSQQRVTELKFIGGNQVEADFELQPYSLVLDMGSDFNDSDLVAAQLARLGRILKMKPGLTSRATKVTLGVGKEAVVVLSGSSA
jgi:hypothetical protein